MTIKLETLVRLFCTGPNARARWKFLYRKLRVCKRETLKAGTDVMLYGTGAVFVPNNIVCDPYRIHPKDIALEKVVDNTT